MATSTPEQEAGFAVFPTKMWPQRYMTQPHRQSVPNSDGGKTREMQVAAISVCCDAAASAASTWDPRKLRWQFIAVSALMHICAIVAVGLYSVAKDAGRGGSQPDAIGVEFIASSVLEAISKVQIPAVAAVAPAPIAEKDGDHSDTNLASQSAASAIPKAPEVDPMTPILSTDTSAQTEELKFASPKLEERRPEPVTDLTPKMHEAAQTDTTARDAEAQGGVQVRSPQGSNPNSAAAGASPGAIQKYAVQVRDALANSRPKGRGKRGTVIVMFIISVEGEVSLAQVTTTSGIARLDEAAVEAIRSVRFPKPPLDMTEKQLTYVIPFRFQ